MMNKSTAVNNLIASCPYFLHCCVSATICYCVMVISGVLTASLSCLWFFLHVHFECKTSIFQRTPNAVSVGRDWFSKLYFFFYHRLVLLPKLSCCLSGILLNGIDHIYTLVSYLSPTLLHRSFNVMYQRLYFPKLLYNQVMFSSEDNYCTQVMMLHQKHVYPFISQYITGFSYLHLSTIKTWRIFYVLLKLAAGRT